jgi:hypothetical protein
LRQSSASSKAGEEEEEQEEEEEEEEVVVVVVEEKAPTGETNPQLLLPQRWRWNPPRRNRQNLPCLLEAGAGGRVGVRKTRKPLPLRRRPWQCLSPLQ